MGIRPTRNELKDVALLGLAYSMLNYSNNATDILVNDDVTQRIDILKEKIRKKSFMNTILEKFLIYTTRTMAIE